MSYHTVILVGNAGRNAELRYTPSGQAVASFSVATNRSYTGSDGSQVKETTWFRVSAWGKLAEICNQYVKKGMTVLVEGRLVADKDTGSPRIWTGNDGSPKTSYEVNADNVRFLSRVEQAEQVNREIPPEDDIPF